MFRQINPFDKMYMTQVTATTNTAIAPIAWVTCNLAKTTEGLVFMCWIVESEPANHSDVDQGPQWLPQSKCVVKHNAL